MGEKKPTLSQQKAIDIDINAVVSAGAGSGKTSVLSKRFVHLVVDKKYKVEEILTLTFTKKATVEMYGRIYKALKEKAPESVTDFYKANIKTIDSYCASIAKQGCHFYGISPDFIEDEDAIQETAESMALPFILQHRDNKAIKALVQTKNFSTIANELFVTPLLEQSTVAEPIDFDDCNQKQKMEIIKSWNKEYKKACDLLHSLNGEFNTFEGNRNSTFIQNLRTALDQDWPETTGLTEQKIENEDCQQELSFLTMMQGVTSLTLRTPKGCDEIKRLIKELRDTFSTLISLVQYVSGYGTIKAIIPLLKEFQDKILHAKRSSGILSYNDVSSLAKCILRDYPEIRQQEKQKFKAIMIDEFQDNNMMQRDLLFMIAEKQERKEKGVPSVNELSPDKLFFVGDEKQSIYRFRGADVSVFRGLSKDFAQGNLELKENFRSEKPLVRAFNTIFGGFSYPDNTEQTQPSVFFKDTTDPVAIPEYEAVYHKVNYDEKKDDHNKEKLIHVALYNKNQRAEEGKASDEEAEAIWVAKKIKDLLTPLPGQKKAKYNPSDIAILFRNYSLQPLYERMLLKEGVSYNCEVVTGFFNDGPVNDIFAMLKLCAYKTDSLSYATVLRSPFANLSFEETNAILVQNAEPFAADTTDILQPASSKRYEHAKSVYIELCNRSKTEQLTSLLTFLWYGAGYRYETMWNTTVSMYANLYDRMFELARQADEQTMSIATFVDNMRTYQDESQKLSNMDIPLEHEESIHILTIHKSKGLEFPVVFVCGTHKGSKRETNSSPVYCSKDFGISINTPPLKKFPESKENFFYAKVKNINAAMEGAELKRLLYVALTRAEKELYITGKYNGECKEAQIPTSLLSALSGVLSFYKSEQSPNDKPFTFEEIPPMSRTEGSDNSSIRKNTKESKTSCISMAKELYDHANIIQMDIPDSPYLLPSSLEKRESKTTGSESGVTVPYKEIDEIVLQSGKHFGFDDFGTLAHYYLEQAIKNTHNSIPAKYLAGLENKAENINRIQKICEQMTQMFKESELGKQALNASWKKAEYAFRSRIRKENQNTIIKGTIDLVFKNADTYTIVDYKTDSHIDPAVYYDQIACYKQAICQMTGCQEQHVHCYLYYLRYGKAVSIDAI